MSLTGLNALQTNERNMIPKNQIWMLGKLRENSSPILQGLKTFGSGRQPEQPRRGHIQLNQHEQTSNILRLLKRSFWQKGKRFAPKNILPSSSSTKSKLLKFT